MDPCAAHAHPKLTAPVSRQQFERELAGVWSKAGLTGTFTVAWPAPMDQRHARTPRSYAQVTLGRAPAFEFATAALWLPPENRSALMIHEAGHVLTPDGTEVDADVAGGQATGERILYDVRWPAQGLQTLSRNASYVVARDNPYDDGFEPPHGELAQPGEEWLTGCKRSVTEAIGQDLGPMTASQLTGEGDCSLSMVRSILAALERMGAVQSHQPTAGMKKKGGRVYTLMPAGRDLVAWIGYRSGLDAATSFDPAAFGETEERVAAAPDPWDWSSRDTGEVEVVVSPPAEPGMEPYVIRAWSSLYPTYPIGELEFWGSATETHDPRKFGKLGPQDYAPITSMRVHPAFRRLGVATRLVLRAAHEAALLGRPVTSPDDRTQSEGRWWSAQAGVGKAKIMRHRGERGHPGASRYLLTESLANPPRSKLCQQGRHDFDPTTAACRRAGCPATLTTTMFPMTQAEEEQAYGFSAERAAQGFKPGGAQQSLFNPQETSMTVAEGVVRIEYGVVPNGNARAGGFLPLLWINGRPSGDTWSGRGLDADQAMAWAQQRASQEAGRYGGDWQITVTPVGQRPTPPGPRTTARTRA